MANTMTKISTYVVPSGGVSYVYFTNIPQRYTDLKLEYSCRSSTSGSPQPVFLTFNSTASGYSDTIMYSNNSSSASAARNSYGAGTQILVGYLPGTDTTNYVFSNNDLYIPNYTSSSYKSIVVDSVSENNSTSSYITSMQAGLWSNTSAINAITLNATFAQYSEFTLYGI